MVGYIGPNGAGKSTTIKMLTGILVPTSGRIVVAGLTPTRQRRALAGRIGVVFGQRTQPGDLPLIESLELLRHIYRVPADRFGANLATFREVLALDDFLATPVRQLSLGQRMRGDLAAALLHDPDILYLDELTIGLDVVAKQHIRDFLLRINRELRGVTVLLTTHDMSDIAMLCQRMMLIDHGKLPTTPTGGDPRASASRTPRRRSDDEDAASGPLTPDGARGAEGRAAGYAFAATRRPPPT